MLKTIALGGVATGNMNAIDAPACSNTDWMPGIVSSPICFGGCEAFGFRHEPEDS